MNEEKEFWHPNRSRLSRKSAFQQLSPERRFCVVMLFIFVFTWTIYMGMAVANAITPDYDGPILTAEERYAGSDDYIQAVASVNNDRIQVVLAVGCDKRPNDIGRTDTIMVGFLDMVTGKLNVLSIPRDTYVTIPGSGSKTKINHAYAYGGIPLTEKTIETAFGVQVDNYVEVNFQGFAELVNAVGGVYIDVPMDMVNANENINLAKGPQHLDGDKALQFVRFREPLLADIGRIGRQQQFMSALVESLMTPATLLKVPKLAEVCMDYVTTDLTLNEIISLASLVLEQDPSSVEFHTLPGKSGSVNGISYWVMDDAAVQELIPQLMGEEVPEEPQTPETPDQEQTPSE